MSRQACCGVAERVHARRAESHPQPWIARKFTVGLTVLIVGYASYVYPARFCKDLITRGSRAVAIVFLVVYALLLLFATWSYWMVITVGPGDARAYVQKTARPVYDQTESVDVRGTSYELASQPHTHASLGSGKSKAVSQVSISASSVAKHDRPSHSQSRGGQEAHIDGDAPHAPTDLPTHANSSYPSASVHPPPMFSRRPTSTPVLLPEYRYCARCQIVKPSRAHHCRACGMCVLKYDHHCPWIGQCVGAFNQKFFINFLSWAALFWFWTFSTLLGFNVKRPELDPQQIVVIALSGLFGLFCSLILMSQIRLVLSNQTTVESLNFRSMRDREQEVMSHMHRWYHCRARRRTRKQWDEEWGRIGIEGNLWWLGSLDANWESVMSANVWWWILPVGGHVGDGMSYATNPRFDGAGRWMRRKEWPTDLQ